MRRRAFVLALLAAAAAGEAPMEPPLAGLLEVRRIYVEPFHGGEPAAQLRDMVMASLYRTGAFAVTENPEKADATLKGSAEDLVFTDTFQSSESISARGAVSTRSGRSQVNSNAAGLSAGVGQNESTRIAERKHEAVAAVRLVNRDGEVIWATTQESMGAKFRGASADVADKITRRLVDDYRRASDRASRETSPSARP